MNYDAGEYNGNVWLAAGLQSGRTKLGKSGFFCGAELHVFSFLFFFSLLTWNQDDDGKLSS